MIIYFERETERIELYGNVLRMYESEEVLIKAQTLYDKINSGGYKDDKCIIVKRSPKRGKRKA